MRKLTTASILIITILGTTSIFLDVSMHLLRPPIADNPGRSVRKSKNRISDQMKSGSPDQCENVNDNSIEQKNLDPDFTDLSKKCGCVCPINTMVMAG